MAADSGSPHRHDGDDACQLDSEIAKAESAYQLMVVADACLKSGADHLLLQLGFSVQHVAELRRRAGPGGGYPRYALRNIQQTLRFLKDTRQAAARDASSSAGTPHD